MSQPRRVGRELLDALPSGDPRAIASRRDLRRVNAWMGQAGIMVRLLRGYGAGAPRTILELGSGDGTFMLGVARRLAPVWPGVTVRLLDRQDLVTAETREAFRAIGWHAVPLVADATDGPDDATGEPADIVAANLFLHHFEPAALGRLLARAAATASFVAACEPRRSALAFAGSRMMFAIGCNDVSRHDAVVSVKAGFRDRDLSGLWPSPERSGSVWRIEEKAAGLFTHTFVARRVEVAP